MVENILTWEEEDEGEKRGSLSYTVERTVPPCRHCIPEGLPIFTDLYDLVLAEVGIERCFSTADKIKCP